MKIKNMFLKDQICYQLGQNTDELTELDIKKIKSINLKRTDYKNEEILYDWDEIENFTNLKSLTLNSFVIDDYIIFKINKFKELQSLTINNCNFKTTNFLESNLKSLVITYSEIKDNYNLLEKLDLLENLELIGCKDVDISEICKIEKLNTLNLYNCNIKNIEFLKNCDYLKEFKYDGSIIDDINVLESLKNDISIHYLKRFILSN